jgi:hypothetical protein
MSTVNIRTFLTIAGLVRLDLPLFRLRRCANLAAFVTTKQRVVFSGLWRCTAAPLLCDASLRELIGRPFQDNPIAGGGSEYAKGVMNRGCSDHAANVSVSRKQLRGADPNGHSRRKRHHPRCLVA